LNLDRFNLRGELRGEQDVEDLGKLVQNLRDKGIKIVSEPSNTEWGYSAVVQVLDGRKIELTESKAAS